MRKVKSTPTASKGGFGLLPPGGDDDNSQGEGESNLDVVSE
jgi:hypothetical protein